MAKREYMAYLLRLWREKQDGSWRGLLENPNSGERLGFATLADLVVLLEDKTGEAVQLAGDQPFKAEAESHS
ncbi:hypothetical protein [Candidatus Leptofilum sp.]|uniref:hypothetical protein n=1 Tax=Candidatus Leptofilum sp. TaxID=3241576 RepID=UPI003B59C0D2